MKVMMPLFFAMVVLMGLNGCGATESETAEELDSIRQGVDCTPPDIVTHCGSNPLNEFTPSGTCLWNYYCDSASTPTYCWTYKCDAPNQGWRRTASPITCANFIALNCN